MQLKRAIIPLLIFLTGQTVFAQLSAPEKKAAAYVDSHIGDAISLLKQTVNINSGTLNIEGVKKVGAIYAEEFKKLGFTVEWVAEPDALKRAGHLVATHVGKKGGKRLLLIGHLDTVFEPDMPAGPYTMINDTLATGQGVNDMKGGDVAVITALQALQAAGQLKDLNLIAYFTGDEERAGTPHEDARKDFIERTKTCQVALGFESADGNTVASARRGASGWVLDVMAKTGHSSGIFSADAGYGAIYEAARVVNEFREQLSNERFLTVNPGLIVAGSETKIDAGDARGVALGKTNIISPTARVTGDLRFLSEAQKETAREKMRAIVAKSLNGTKSTITFTDGLPSMPPTPGNGALVTVVDKVSRDLGEIHIIAGDPGLRGAGDISDVAQYLDCLDGMGASGTGGHKAGETINLKNYPYLIKRAAVTIYRLGK
ncbi:MAG: peptidase [Mucilaginibacter sp.]|uniref:M20/M25/M40 family metallo-hydrolase n=1 Tax=Mucilaginibacter sp. TaxID=1882438 RepID=UPI00262DB70C|nr:M20/M25/M40 family metallo-hydrolase [Mucilaginibacter sp.]MDB5003037.1 peptidase [Mucilaginibacter sp.]